MNLEMLKSLVPAKGDPVVPVTFRMPLPLHGRLQRAIGEVMIQTGRNVSQNALLIALVADALDRLEGDQDSDSGSP